MICVSYGETCIEKIVFDRFISSDAFSYRNNFIIFFIFDFMFQLLNAFPYPKSQEYVLFEWRRWTKCQFSGFAYDLRTFSQWLFSSIRSILLVLTSHETNFQSNPHQKLHSFLFLVKLFELQINGSWKFSHSTENWLDIIDKWIDWQFSHM